MIRMICEKQFISKTDDDRINQIFFDKITEYNEKNEHYTHIILISPYVLFIEWDVRWERKVYLIDETMPFSQTCSIIEKEKEDEKENCETCRFSKTCETGKFVLKCEDPVGYQYLLSNIEKNCNQYKRRAKKK